MIVCVVYPSVKQFNWHFQICSLSKGKKKHTHTQTGDAIKLLKQLTHIKLAMLVEIFEQNSIESMPGTL